MSNQQPAIRQFPHNIQLPANRWETMNTEWAGPAAHTPSQLLEYWNVMKANLGKIAMIAVAGAGLGWLLASVRPAMYQSRAVLDIRSLNDNILSAKGASTETTGGVLPESYVQTEIKILSSESLRKRALDRVLHAQQAGLAKMPPVDVSSSWLSSFRSRFDPATTPYKTLAADAANRVKVRAVGNTRIVELLCDARDGQLAADMCNALAQSYIEYNLESRYKSTKETGDWLQSQLDDVRKRLTKAENELKDSSKETAFLFDAEATDNPVREQLRHLQTELSRSESEKIHAETEFETVSSRTADTLPTNLDSGPIREYRLRLADLNRQLAEVSATMTPEHYKVRELKMQIDEVERDIERERRSTIERLRADYDSAQRQTQVFESKYKQKAAQMSAQADKTVRYNMLKREVDSERGLYETLLQKVDEVGLAAALHTSAISVVDPAVSPTLPYSPNRAMFLGLGALIGSLGGLAFSLLNVRSDRTLRDPGETSMHLQLRELGVIPSVRQSRATQLLGRTRPGLNSGSSDPSGLTGALDLKSNSRTNGNGSYRSSMALGSWLRIPEMTEAFFGTVSSLRFASERGERADVIVLTSPEPGDGKTTVATNLATVLAEMGRRVILVDGDVRKPSLDKIFDRKCVAGLAEIMESDEPIDEITLGQHVVRTAIPGLWLLPTKAAHQGIATKFHSTRMRLLIERLRNEYDTVIIDSPPMLRIADARVLGWMADGVLLVLRARKTTKEQAFAAYDCLLQDGIHVFGTVLNDWNPGKGENYGAYKPYRKRLAAPETGARS